MSDLRTAFRFHRQNGMRAFLALEAARTDLEKRVARYPTCGDIGAASAEGARFVERPAANGLRFVGYVDDILPIRHQGHYTNPDQCDSIRGVVYQLPSRGRTVFVAGHDNADNGAADEGGPAYLDFGTLFYGDKGGWSHDPENDSGARDAARHADSFAQGQAEQEMEYQTAWQAGSRYQSVLEDYRTTRGTILKQLLHLRGMLRDTESDMTIEILGRLQNDANALRSECFGEMSKLQSGDHDGLIFYPDARLQAAFNEGRG